MDNRRQSGLWGQNEATGLHERQSTSANPGPYEYYQPPGRTSTSDRRSFAERAGAPSSPYDAGPSDLTDPPESPVDHEAVKTNTRAALMAHEHVLASPEHAELVKQLHEHEAGGEVGSEHLAKSRHVNDTMPAAITVGTGTTDSEQFRATHHASEAGLEDTAGNIYAGEGTNTEGHDETGSESFPSTTHMDETEWQRKDVHPGISTNPVDDEVPENLRTKAWSPGPDALPEEKAIPSAPVSDLPIRRASVPDRSPLQKLERESSKEEKRVRLQEAENRAIQRQGTLRSEKGRVVSDGSRRTSESTSDKYYQQSPRQVSAGSATLGGLPPADRTQRGSESWRGGTFTSGLPDIAREARPYHHAPSVPRSLDSTRRKDGAPNGLPAIAKEPRPYHHAPAMPRSMDSAGHTTAIAREPRPYHHAPAMPRSMDSARRMTAIQNSRALPSQGGFTTPPIAKEPRPYHHAPAVPRSLVAVQNGFKNDQRRSFEQSRTASMDVSQGASDVYRSPSGTYKHRLRDAGFAGAAAAATVGTGVLAYEDTSGTDHATTESRQSNDLARTGSKKLQKASLVGRTSVDSQRDSVGKQPLQNERIGDGTSGSTRARLARHLKDEPDPVSREQVKTAHGNPLSYTMPPQTASGQAARKQVGFDTSGPAAPQRQDEHHHALGSMFHHHHDTGSRGYQPAKPLDEWRGALPVLLPLADLEFDEDHRARIEGSTETRDSVWWEKNRGSQRTSSSRQSQPAISQYDGPYEEAAKLFRPPMFLKCGPLLRYTGMRKESQREIWRGSVMIVTEDDQSDYSTVPTLRLFAQSMDLHQPPSKRLLESGQELSPEHEDPLAGQVKVSRTGRPLYVRPVGDIEHGVDLSREENNQGLYAATRVPLLGTRMSTGPDGTQSQHITFQDRSRIKGWDGEKAGRYKEVKAIRLHTERGFTFWRWSIEIELGSRQHRVAYRINRGPALGFWVPARGETMNVMFHSCNGFSLPVDSNQFCGPDPLWRDVLNKHQSRPFHVMVGGGDQIYNDAAMQDTTLFREWLQKKNPESKHGADFSAEMQDELETFYLNRYSMWFSQGLFAMAGSQIPMVNIWDDHDIIDGYGSYPHHFMSTRVFTGVGAIAFKYYMLFQHQSVAAETAKEEPSWVLGSGPGPYINELSRHVFLDFGHKVKFLGVDCRTERMRDEVLSEHTYDILFDKCRTEIQTGDTRHLIVLLGVPIAYPRLNFLENILTSRVMDPIKAIGRTGMLGGFVNRFDGGVEILDDLDDHWAARHHKAERNWFIQELQELAAEKSVRITILGGDVHLGAIGQFYTPKKFGISKDRDHRYMPNVISSAIVNTPPPIIMADVLNRRNKVHHLDSETDEDMIPMFDVDVDGSKRNNKCLLPRRNYCTIREFEPEHTPPPTPPPAELGAQDTELDGRDRRYPPGSMARRTMSLTRGPGSLIRRLSGSRRKNSSSDTSGLARSQSLDEQRPQPVTNGAAIEVPPRRPSFHRRPTNLTEKEVRKAAARGGAPDEEGVEEGRQPGHINLEHGLDITLNVEIDQHDPMGATQSYRLLVPALWYSGVPDINTAHIKSRRGTILDRIRGRNKRAAESDDLSPSPSPRTEQQPARTTTQSGPDSGYEPGQDGAHDSRNGASTQQQAIDHTAAAYGRGYNLVAPPIGSGQITQQTGGAMYNNPYPQSGYRPASSIPAFQTHGQEGPQEHEQDEYSEGSFTSDEYVDAPSRPQRRPSKAERFFGFGGGGGGGHRDSMQDDGAFTAAASPQQKKKPNWMVWK